MKKKLAVFDLDGTLLNRHRAISAENLKAIEALSENGYEIVFASGRPEILMRAYFLPIPFVKYVLSSNGGMIRDVRADKIIHHQSIPAEAIQKLLDISAKHGSGCDLYSHIGMSDIDTTEIDKQVTDEIMFDFKNGILKDRKMQNFPCEKSFLYEPRPEVLVALEAEIAERVPEVEITQSSRNALDIMAKGVNKGSCVKWLAEYLKIDRENVVTFGDQKNDREMLAYAGISFACSNAVEEAKEVATYVMEESNHESGVAKAIWKYLL